MHIHRRHIGRKRGAALKKRREKNAENGELGRSIILLLLSLFLLCGITLAWFTMNRAAGSGGPVLGAKIPYIPFTLYRLTVLAAEGENTVVIGGRVYGWTQVQDIDFSEAVPNRADRYLVELNDAAQSADTLRLTIEGLTAGDHGAGGAALLDFLHFREQAAADSLLTTFTDLGSASLLCFRDAAVESGGVLTGVRFPFSSAGNRFIFDIYFDKDACAYYQGAGMTGRVELELDAAPSVSSSD